MFFSCCSTLFTHQFYIPPFLPCKHSSALSLSLSSLSSLPLQSTMNRFSLDLFSTKTNVLLSGHTHIAASYRLLLHRLCPIPWLSTVIVVLKTTGLCKPRDIGLCDGISDLRAWIHMPCQAGQWAQLSKKKKSNMFGLCIILSVIYMRMCRKLHFALPK